MNKDISKYRLDEIGFGSLKMYQDPTDFCYGVDAVILADFMCNTKGKSIIDLGCGNGIIPLIISHKLRDVKITGIEVREKAYELALKNLEINDLDKSICLINKDIMDFDQSLGVYDTVVTNPPYFAGGSGVINNHNLSKMTARHETTATLSDFLRIASTLLIDKGEFYMIHRPSRTVEVINNLSKYNLEPKIIRYVSPRQGMVPNIMLIKAVKNGGSEVEIREPLYIYDADDSYSDEIMKIYERV